MNKYYPLVIVGITRETPHAVVIEIDVPAELKEKFRFQAGQYLGVRAVIDDTDVRRSYSICSEPGEEILRIGVKEVPGGLFSTYANNALKMGDTLEVMPPVGKFTRTCTPERRGHYVFFASGSGITPVISLVKSHLRQEPLSHVTLIYGNRSTESIMFREELDGLKNRYMNRLSVHHILSRERQNSPFYNGRIDAEKCSTFGKVFFVPKKVDQFFICGPEAMITEINSWLKDYGISEDKIAFELFTSPTSRAFIADNQFMKVLANPEKESVVTVRIDGNTQDFHLAYGGDNILEAAVAAGADAPFSCKGGVCCTCKAMLMDGEVEMDVVYGLEPDEIEDGYILTCQSHPRSETVLVDYDV
jgi:ring-1,2-phenylacetyl-CoA epoxidase subunit PaaE